MKRAAVAGRLRISRATRSGRFGGLRVEWKKQDGGWAVEDDRARSHRRKLPSLLQNAEGQNVEQGDREIANQKMLRRWLWVVYAVGFLSGTLTMLGIAQLVGWF